MIKILGATGLILVLVGCQSKKIIQRDYFEPTEKNRVEIEYVNEDGITVKEIRGALKRETICNEDGSRDFSPGKHFELTIEGISLQ